MLSPEKLQQLRSEPLDGPNKVSRARELMGVTQVVAADHLEISQPYLSSIERGQSPNTPVDLLRRMARYFGCLIEDLFPAPECASVASSDEAVTQ